jgi:uncharacterized protein GlcG (DUF336 family)
MKKIVMLMVVSALGFSGALFADDKDHDDDNDVCNAVMDAIAASATDSGSGYDVLTAALEDAQDTVNGGYNLEMWATVVATDGTVCAVTKTGDELNDQWLGSRVISAQKANTAIAFSLPVLALSTANLWAPTQPGGPLFGLQFSNPVDTKTAYKGNAGNFGEHNDPMVNHRIGGVNVFGGGLALYNADGLIGAIGVSGDSSCADHNIAWRVRHALGLDYVPGGVNSDGSDNIIFDLDAVDNPDTAEIEGGPSGFGHPVCTGEDNKTLNAGMVADNPIKSAE